MNKSAHSPRAYVAAKLENGERAKEVATALEAAGWQITYAWWVHGSVQHDENLMRNVAQLEMDGVRDADLLVALLPGGRGTHCEIGAALALRKPVVMWAPDPTLVKALDGTVCAFYHHPLIVHVETVDAIPLTAEGVLNAHVTAREIASQYRPTNPMTRP